MATQTSQGLSSRSNRYNCRFKSLLLQAAEPTQPGKASWGSQEATLPRFINPSEQSSRKKKAPSPSPASSSHQETLFQPLLGHSLLHSHHFISPDPSILHTKEEGVFFLPSMCMGEMKAGQAARKLDTTKTCTK